ncbi:hypothetical protein LTR94_035518, partial [Friedmanniomyces endolithicus]
RPGPPALHGQLARRSDRRFGLRPILAGPARRGTVDRRPQPRNPALAPVRPRPDGPALGLGVSREGAHHRLRAGHAEQADAAGAADPGGHRPGRPSDRSRS